MISAILILIAIAVIVPAIIIPVANVIEYGKAYPTTDDIMQSILDKR